MKYNVNNIDNKYNFWVEGISYIGKPKSNTVMYISKKVEFLLDALAEMDNCLVFAENGMNVKQTIKEKICFVFCENPQYAYAQFLNMVYAEDIKCERSMKYTLQTEGYYLGVNAKIGKNAYIEPGCVIGHNVIIGDNATIYANSVIKHSIIGDNFVANEGSVIGADGFALTKDDNGNWYRLPTLGNVLIGNNVEIGANDNISRGTAGPTKIDDFVKIDALVHIGHDAHLSKNTEITAGGIIGGYVEFKPNASTGINATVRNRIEIGENSMIGMGSTVTKSVEKGITVIGNPARRLLKKEK